MAKKQTVTVKTEDWNDLLKASAKREPVFIVVKIKDLKPLPAVVVKTQNVVTIEVEGVRIDESKLNTAWLAVENVKDYVKEPRPKELEVAYASSFEEAKTWAKKLNG